MFCCNPRLLSLSLSLSLYILGKSNESLSALELLAVLEVTGVYLHALRKFSVKVSRKLREGPAQVDSLISRQKLQKMCSYYLL